jgi:hypothetical protein
MEKVGRLRLGDTPRETTTHEAGKPRLIVRADHFGHRGCIIKTRG